MKTQILLVFLLVLAAADQFDKFREIDKDEFGRTLIDTLQVQLGSGEPISRFTEIMRNLEGSIEQEQREDDQDNNKYQSTCTDDISVMRQDAANLERRTVEIQSILDELEPLKSYKEGQAQAKRQWKEETEKKLAELIDKRNKEKAEYDKKVEEHQYAAFVIETVKRMFGDKEPSFLETASSKKWEQIKEYFVNASEQAKKFEIKRSYAQLFMVLAQITAGAQSEDFKNSPTIGRIVSLCDQMLKNIEESMDLENRAESKRLNMFTIEKGNFDKDLDKLNNTLAQLEAEILQLSNRIQDQQRDMDDFKTRLANKQKQTDDRGQECREKAYNYQQARDKREQKRQLVSQIIGIFTANQRDFSEYVKLRGQAGDYKGKQFDVLGNPNEE